MTSRPIYLDCNATSPIEPSVLSIAQEYMSEEFGNSGSRTHVYGSKAKSAVEKARAETASLLNADADEVIFTSGATESNNICILGLTDFGLRTNRRHIITSAQEHKAVLEPIERLRSKGFEVSVLTPDAEGIVSADALANALREDTLLTSLMHVNNETGVVQPISEYTKVLGNHNSFLHIDAAQSYGKIIESLKDKRIDFISASGHKIYSPKGIGILLARCRNYDDPPLEPLMFGGGQEKGIRPGTLPVYLIAAFGEASRLALKNHINRKKKNIEIKEKAVKCLTELGGIVNGDQKNCIPSTLNISFPGLDSEAIILQLKDMIAISNGSACTSSSYSFSHVLTSMGLSRERVKGAVRISWCHLTPEVDWGGVAKQISSMYK